MKWFKHLRSARESRERIRQLMRKLDETFLLALHTLEVQKEKDERDFLRRNRDELTMLWDEQFATLATPMPEHQRDRIWKASYEWWMTIIRVKEDGGMFHA